jgi:hypothetical protein
MYPEGRERASDDPGRLREPYVEPVRCCSSCGIMIHWTDRGGRGPIRLQGVGEFCTERCADAGSLQHEAAMNLYGR